MMFDETEEEGRRRERGRGRRRGGGGGGGKENMLSEGCHISSIQFLTSNSCIKFPLSFKVTDMILINCILMYYIMSSGTLSNHSVFVMKIINICVRTLIVT